jgi:restriction system protein
MTFADAAYTILKEAGEPLHYREITERALERQLVETEGKTPAATLNAIITLEIKRAQKGGSLARFVRVGRGIVALSEWGKAQPTDTEGEVSNSDDEKQGSYLSYKDAALRVLRQAKQPLSIQDITERAVSMELINPQGLTPDATMGAQLYMDIKRQGAASRFRKEGRNLFGLAEWEQGVQGVVRLAARQLRETKRALREALLRISPGDFEQLVGRLLGAMGYQDVTVTRRSGDGGIDVVAEIETGILELRTAVQVKRLRSNVQRPVVSQLRGDMALMDVDQGMIITTSGFSQGAKGVARVRNAAPITLIDGDRLADLLIEHGIGVRSETIEVVSFDQPGLLSEEDI